MTGALSSSPAEKPTNKFVNPPTNAFTGPLVCSNSDTPLTKASPASSFWFWEPSLNGRRTPHADVLGLVAALLALGNWCALVPKHDPTPTI